MMPITAASLPNNRITTKVMPINRGIAAKKPQHNVGDVDLCLAPHRGSDATGVVYHEPTHKTASERLIVTCLIA